MSHRASLLVAYAVAALILAGAIKLRPKLWPARDGDGGRTVGQRWGELGLAILAVVGVLAIGQAWSAGIRLSGRGAFGPIAEALNQLAIFSPIVALVWLRRKHALSPWWRRDQPLLRVSFGVGTALAALFTYSLVRDGHRDLATLVREAARYDSLDELVQVALEDLSIAAIFVRIQAVMRSRTLAVVLVAGLFAGSHVPAMLAYDASSQEVLGLVTDAIIGVVVISVASRAGDLLWLVPVHFALDMSQRV